jgi:uroporphyrinogen III methyltransferase/synthase
MIGGVTMTMVKKKPLQGKTIVITRAQHQAAEFSRELIERGAQVIEFPTIEIAPPDGWDPVDEAIDHLHRYDWVIFTSANGVSFFMKRLKERGETIEKLRDLRICAIGPRTAEEIRRQGVDVHVIPGEYRAEAVVESLAGAALRGKRVLIARAKKAREILPKELRNLGASVDVVSVYQTVRPTRDPGEFLQLLGEGRIDTIAFTSSSTVSNFMNLFANREADLLKGLKDVAIAVIGPVTRKTAHDLGLPVHISPADYTIPALAGAIEAYYGSRG